MTNLGGFNFNNTGLDTIYAVDNDSAAGATVQKWTFNGTTWTARGSISLADVNNITAIKNGSDVTLFVTTTTTIQTLTDSTGVAGDLTGTFATIVTAGATDGFRGIVLIPTPIPEPATVLLIGLAGAGVVARLRRRV
jgi:hypothetical protein